VLKPRIRRTKYGKKKVDGAAYGFHIDMTPTLTLLCCCSHFYYDYHVKPAAVMGINLPADKEEVVGDMGNVVFIRI
jgi:hypothetical protein